MNNETNPNLNQIMQLGGETQDRADLVRRQVTTHSTGEELCAYYDEMATPTERQRIAAHLDGCAQCRREYETLAGHLQSFAAVLPPSETPSPLFPLREWWTGKIKPLLAGLVLPDFAAGFGQAAGESLPLSFGDTAAGLYGDMFADETAGTLRLVTYTTRLELVGAVLTWRVGAKVWPAVFYRCDENELCAETEIAAAALPGPDADNLALVPDCRTLDELDDDDATPELLAHLAELLASGKPPAIYAALRVAAKLRAVTHCGEIRAELAKLIADKR